MTDIPMKIIFDATTKEITEVPLTEEEIAELASLRQLEIEKEAAREAEAQALADLKASAKAKLVAGEPLTEEEASTLVI